MGSLSPRNSTHSEQGFALLMVTFVIALATLLVLDFQSDINAFQRSSRNYAEQIQANLMLKSAVNLAKLLIEAPKPEETKDEDWLYEAWNNVAAVPAIPLEGLNGELRLMIVDEDGKIDINAIQGFGGLPGGGGTVSPQTGGRGPGTPPLLDNNSFWRNAVKELFTIEGFHRETYPADSYRTLGNTAFDAGDQVAVLNDWMDRDTESFHAAGFDGNGVESGADKAWFYNRQFRHLAELAAVPGMTLERLQSIAPFLRVSQSVGGISTSVNINTAPVEVLVAIGFPQAQAQEIAEQRLKAPFTREILTTLTAGDPNLANRVKVKSAEFSAYARVIMPTRTFWVRAILAAQQTQRGRRALVRSMEFY